jgi:hypothetical protein
MDVFHLIASARSFLTLDDVEELITNLMEGTKDQAALEARTHVINNMLSISDMSIFCHELRNNSSALDGSSH